MSVCMILNPTAGGHRAAELRSKLEDLAGLDAVRYTTGPGGARAVAQRAALDGFETIVAAGGDGTVNEVLNGLGDVPGAFDRVRLGLLPAGTTNVLAHELGLPFRPLQAWRIVLQGKEARCDVLQAHYHRQGAACSQLFAQLAGAGLDARAIGLVDPEHKRRWGQFAYVIAGCEALSEPGDRIEVQTPQRRLEGELVLIGNGKRYGGRFRFFPNAQMNDGLLDVVVFPKATWGSAVRTLFGWFAGHLDTAAGAQSFQTDTLTLTSQSRVHFELDGELVGPLPVTFSVLPRAMRVLVP